MTVTIPFEQFNEDIKAYYSAEQINSLSIDYMYNAIMGYINGVEVEIFNFSKICKLDNRYHSYNLYKGPAYITIEFIVNE